MLQLLMPMQSKYYLLKSSYCVQYNYFNLSSMTHPLSRMLKLLLDAGADVNAQDQYSLQTAVGRGNTSNLIGLFLKYTLYSTLTITRP